MSKPTLAIKGKLVAIKNTTQDQSVLDEWIPYKYIINLIETKLKKTGIENRLLALQAKTASGKSTLLPAELYLHFSHPLVLQNIKPKGIICTQPRVATAEQNVKQIVHKSTPHYTKTFKIGDNIGWATKYNKFKPKRYGLLSVTLGTLLREMQSSTDDDIMNKYQIVIIDEVHERTQQLEVLLTMIKKFLMKNANDPRCPFFILTSATFSPYNYVKFYGVSNENILICEGETAQIDEYYLPHDSSNYIESIGEIVEKICTDIGKDDEPGKNDILVFMSTTKMINTCYDYMSKNYKKLNLLIIKLTSQIYNDPLSNFDNIHKDLDEKYSRRLIISTNVIETGLTINSLKYVIDTGYNKQLEYDPHYNLHLLPIVPITNSRRTQRRGRVGRKFNGVFYGVYTKEVMKMMKNENYPEILLLNADDLLLQLYTMFKDKLDIKELDFLQPIPTDTLWAALEKLYTLGIISPLEKLPSYQSEIKDDFKKYEEWRKLYIENKPNTEPIRFSEDTIVQYTGIGELSHRLLDLFIPLEFIRMILAGYYWECSIMDLIHMTAWGYHDTIKTEQNKGINWEYIYGKDYFEYRFFIQDYLIDGIYFFDSLNKHFRKATDRKSAYHILEQWCKKINISIESVFSLVELRDTIMNQMLMSQFDIYFNDDKSLLSDSSGDKFQDKLMKLKYCIYDGFKLNIMQLDGTVYKAKRGGFEVIPKNIYTKKEYQRWKDLNININRDNILPNRVMYINKLSGPYHDKFSSIDGWIHTDV